MPDDLLIRLAAMPALLRLIAASLTDVAARTPGGGGFAFVEHAWHLADLEREGYGARITRILAEERPSLADFDGDRAAREREYLRADPALGVEIFAQARRRNVERLRPLDAAALGRPAVQDGVGELTLASVPAMMAGHDRQHAAELAALLEALGAPAAVRDAVRAHAGEPGPAARGSRAA
jgi:hypothetical protein